MRTVSLLVASFPLAVAAIAHAEYPDRPIRVIVSVPAGGTPDVMARMVTTGMSRALGQPLVVDNRGGAAGLIGAETAAKSAPDGYTLFVSSAGALTILPHMQKIAYDPQKDFAPIGLIASNPFLLVVHPSVPAKTVKELIALAKAQPGKLNGGSAGSGSPNHLALELFKSMAGVNITHVPYKGAPQMVSDVVAGHMNVIFNSIPPVLAHLRADRLRALGIGGPKRSAQLPEVPTISEAGVKGFEAIAWFGMLAPAKTPKEIVSRLNVEVDKAIKSPDIQQRFVNEGLEPMGGSPEAFTKFMRAEIEKYAKVIKVAGIAKQ